jgi:hypothetical protein
MTVAELVAKLGIDMDRASWDKAQSGFDKLKHAAEGVVEALAVREIAHKLSEIVDGSIESANEVERLAAQLGITTDKVQELGFATKEIGQQGMTMALRQLSAHAYAASTKGGEAAAVFAKMGVSVRGANGQLLPADQLLERVADGMQRTKNPTDRIALSMQLFGRQGMRMIDVVKDGSKGLKEMYEQARRLGYISERQIEMSKKAEKEQHNVNYMTKTLRDSIADKLLPAKIELLRMTQRVIEWFTNLARHTEIVKEAAVALGVVMMALAVRSFIAVATSIGMLGMAFLAFGAIMFFVIDDILATLRGGDSLGKHFVAWVEGVADGFLRWRSASTVINALLDPVKELVFWLGMAVDSLNAVIMAATGDFSGFRYIKDQIQDRYGGMVGALKEGAISLGKSGLDAAGRAFLGIGPEGTIGEQAGRRMVAPSSAAVASSVANNASMNAPINVNQTINAAPGQSAQAIADFAADSLKDVLTQSHLDMAHAKLWPQPTGAQ